MDGSLWIGTAGGGLVLRRDEKFTLISVTNGLPDDIIAGMVEDDAGRLWCGALGGIFHVAKADLLAFADGKIPKVNGITFSKSEGSGGHFLPRHLPSRWPAELPTASCGLRRSRACCRWIPPALKINSRPPPVFIDELFVNDRPLEITDPLQVPPLCNKIEFRFSVLSYAGPEGVRVRYKLDGVDSDWVEMVNQRAAVYSAIAAWKIPDALESLQQ